MLPIVNININMDTTQEEEDITTHDLKMFKTNEEYARCLLSRLRPGDVAWWDNSFGVFEERKLDENGNWTGEVKWGRSPVSANFPRVTLYEHNATLISLAIMIHDKDIDMACFEGKIAFLSRSKTQRISRERVKGAKVGRGGEEEV